MYLDTILVIAHGLTLHLCIENVIAVYVVKKVLNHKAKDQELVIHLDGYFHRKSLIQLWYEHQLSVK